MKKILLIILSIVLLILPFGCQKADSGKVKICVTMYPLYDFACKIAEDKADIISIVPTGDLHHYTPTTSDMMNITESDLVIYNGAGLEEWLEDIMETLDDSVKAVEAANGIALLDSNGELITDETEEHEIDPHIWLYPLNAKKMMENIKNAITDIDPENADFYNANYLKYAAEFDKLDNEYITQLQNIVVDTIIVAHKAFGYLCHAYGLNQVAALDENAEGDLSITDMESLKNIINEKGIKIVFYEELQGDDTAQSLVEASNAESIMPLSPVNALTDKQSSDGDDYFAIMRANLTAIKAAVL